MCAYNNNARRNYIDEDYFEIIDTEDKAYWLGFIQADGCIYRQETTYRFQINLSRKDKDQLERFNKTINSTYKITDKKVGKYEVSMLKINSKPFCERLMKHGIVPRKSLNDFLPDLPNELLRHFVRGFFDGDGGISLKGKKARVSFVGSKEFLTKFKQVLITNAGVQFSPKSIQKNCKSKAYQMNLDVRKDIAKLYDYMYKEAVVYMPRKKEKFTRYLDKSPIEVIL